MSKRAIGCVAAAVSVAGLAFAGLCAVAYFSLRDLDEDLDFEGPEIPDFDPNALVPPDPNEVQALDAVSGAPGWRTHVGYGSWFLGASDDLLIVRRKREILGLEASSGSTRWRIEVDPRTSARVSDGAVVRMTAGGSVVAHDALTGVERWRARDVGVGISSLEVGSGSAVVISGRTRRVQAFDLASGMEQWSGDLPTHWFATRIVGDAVILQTTLGALSLDLATGATRWIWNQPPSDDDSDIFTAFLDAPLPAGSVVGIQILEPVVGDGTLPTTATIFIDVATGAEVWRTSSGALSSLAFDAVTNTVFELGGSGGLNARDASTGVPRWEAPAPFGRLLAHAGRVFVTDESVRVFDAASGVEGWSRFIGLDAGATPVAVVSGWLVITDELGVPDSD